MRTELSRPREPALKTRMVEKGIQQHSILVHSYSYFSNIMFVTYLLKPVSK